MFDCAVALGVGAADRRGAGAPFPLSSDCFGDFLDEAEGVGERFGCFFFVGGDSLVLRDFRAFALGLFFGAGVGDSSSSACFALCGAGVSLGEGFAVAFFLCFAVFGFAVGLGDSSGDVDAAARAFRNCARFSFSSSVSCAWTSVPMIPLSASKVASQRRKRNTAAKRNRAGGAIKRPAPQWQALVSPLRLRIRVRGEGSRSICRQEAGANK